VPDIYTESTELKALSAREAHYLSSAWLPFQPNSGMLQLQFKPYSRTFTRPWVLRGKPWKKREGFVLRLDSGNGPAGWGEVAPLPAFGTETVEEAREVLGAFSKSLDASLLKGFPCVQFGLSSALASQQDVFPGERTLDVAAFLPQGAEALEALRHGVAGGFQTFKWKVGSLDSETMGLFGEIIKRLPEGGKLRLDANGLLTKDEAHAWLELCEGAPVEFFEQPLSVLEHMQTLAESYSTPLALDESATTLAQCKEAISQGWKGDFVIKPSTIGDWGAFCAWHATVPGRCVYSTAFETAVGATAGLRLAALDLGGRAVGYGALCGMPQDGLGLPAFGPQISVAGRVDQEKMEVLWNAL